MRRFIAIMFAAVLIASSVLLTGCSCLCGPPETPPYYPTQEQHSSQPEPTATTEKHPPETTPSAQAEATCSGEASADYIDEYIGAWASMMPVPIPQPAQGLSGNGSSMIKNDEAVYYRASTMYVTEETLQKWRDAMAESGWTRSTDADADKNFTDKITAATNGVKDPAEDGQIKEATHEIYTHPDGSMLQLVYGPGPENDGLLSAVMTYLNKSYT